MVLARVQIREDLTADISDAPPRLRLLIGVTERVEIVSKDQEVVIARDGVEVRAHAVELFEVRCSQCHESTWARMNTGRCAYCGTTDPKLVRPVYSEARIGLVAKP